MADFTSFRFGNFHTKDLNLVVISSGSRYNKNLLPEINNYSTDVVGSDGQYYFGSTFNTQQFTVNVAFDSLTETDWRKLSQIFATDKLKDLVFDELPFKTYRAKVSQKPDFQYVCFRDRKTGERCYKGEGIINFICYFPYGFGFNKYLVRAADYYLKEPPENIIKHHYNVEGNMNMLWKGGFPTIEQVQKGELFFDTPDGEKTIIDTRRYWDNLPKWSESSGLLTTPTLDFEQQLMYLPQYSKVNYINMDMGLNNENALIGSRLLVYNSGDVPIDFKLELNMNDRSFWTTRGNHFQIRRFNVQRLNLVNAVDWTGLKTFEDGENEDFKYGEKYFKRIITTQDSSGFKTPSYTNLETHPRHCYMAEPIPRQRLGHYIKLFYWQSNQLFNENDDLYLDYETGERYADRYNELYSLCITDEERFELYWKTLKEAILSTYAAAKFFDNTYSDEEFTIEQFIYDFIHSPKEYVDKDKTKMANEIDFNISLPPQYIADDYLEIVSENIKNNILYLDTEKRLLYNIDDTKDFYNYKTKKNIYNDNIVKGKWFKIPTGWSLIEVTPVIDSKNDGKKTWGDARPFDWGYPPNKRQTIQQFYDKVYAVAENRILNKYNKNSINFRDWYKDEINLAINSGDTLSAQLFMNLEESREYEFLKLIHEYWRVNKNETINGTIDEWWWYACNYIWANFPPLYWGFADILNQAKIDYIPLYY